MRFAKYGDERIEATPDFKDSGKVALCPVCGEKVTARCGDIRMNHWAHKKGTQCSDTWFERETPWHRMWKSFFPNEAQEVPHRDPKTGEIHIADVELQNIVYEFQHSAISAEERKSRENFYKTMIWIVDGTRCPSEYEKFERGFTQGALRLVSPQIKHLYNYASRVFPSKWRPLNACVAYDFLGMEHFEDAVGLKRFIYCLLPHFDVCFAFPRKEFVDLMQKNILYRVLSDWYSILYKLSCPRKPDSLAPAPCWQSPRL